MKQDLASTPVFPSSSTVGGQVAGDSRSLAIIALVASWIGIIIYVWVRFQNLIFGLAAVIALIHDVLITVTAIAVSAYLTGALRIPAGRRLQDQPDRSSRRCSRSSAIPSTTRS